MGHSILMVGDRHGIFNDFDLFVVIGLAPDLSADRPELSPLLDRWRAQVFEAGPGCIELDLESVAGDPDLRESLLGLLENIETFADRFGSELPASMLNALLQTGSIKFIHGYDRARLVATLARIRSLLRGQGMRTPG